MRHGEGVVGCLGVPRSVDSVEHREIDDPHVAGLAGADRWAQEWASQVSKDLRGEPPLIRHHEHEVARHGASPLEEASALVV